jgi:hypothetical protein
MFQIQNSVINLHHREDFVFKLDFRRFYCYKYVWIALLALAPSGIGYGCALNKKNVSRACDFVEGQGVVIFILLYDGHLLYIPIVKSIRLK